MDGFDASTWITFLFFIAGSAFFSSSETAFTAIGPLKLRSIVDQKGPSHQTIEELLKNPRRLITGLLIGNTIMNMGASAMATTVMLNILQQFNISNYATQMAIVTGVMTFIMLTFGEITPKILAIKAPEKYVSIIAKPVYFFLLIINPLILFFLYLSKFFSKIIGLSEERFNAVLTADELKSIVKMSHEEGVLEKEEINMIQGIFDFSETIVREVMTPRTDMIAIRSTQNVADAIKLIYQKGHSRIPVYEDKIDNIAGIIYAKDLLQIDPSANKSLKELMRKAVFIPEIKTLEDVLEIMQKNKIHIAIAVDEYGGTSGLITLEDILEEIVGDIKDEYDKDEKPELQKLSDIHFIAEASISIDDLGEALHCDFPEDDDYDSLGGFLLSQFDEFPEVGATLEYKEFQFTVKEIEKRRIKKVDILAIPKEESDTE